MKLALDTTYECAYQVVGISQSGIHTAAAVYTSTGVLVSSSEMIISLLHMCEYLSRTLYDADSSACCKPVRILFSNNSGILYR